MKNFHFSRHIFLTAPFPWVFLILTVELHAVTYFQLTFLKGSFLTPHSFRLQSPWRVLIPVFLFSLAMSILCVHASTVTENGLQAFCDTLAEITNGYPCVLFQNLYPETCKILQNSSRVRELIVKHVAKNISEKVQSTADKALQLCCKIALNVTE